MKKQHNIFLYYPLLVKEGCQKGGVVASNHPNQINHSGRCLRPGLSALLRASTVSDTSRNSLQPFLITTVAFGTHLNTDEWLGYNGLKGIYKHQYINHKAEEYVRGDVHTNGIEGFWSLLKRSVYGIYHSVSTKHLQAYVDESVFRYNTRGKSENGRFDYMLSNCNHHITYKQLIQKNDTSENIVTDNRYMEGQQGVISF